MYYIQLITGTIIRTPIEIVQNHIGPVFRKDAEIQLSGEVQFKTVKKVSFHSSMVAMLWEE